MPVESSTDPIVRLAEERDVISSLREVIGTLKVPDSSDLANRTSDEVRKACQRRSGDEWDEITRVLESLGYDVSKARGGKVLVLVRL